LLLNCSNSVPPHVHVYRIAEREKQWQAKLKEALERKDRRIKAAHSEREKMVGEVSRLLAVSIL